MAERADTPEAMAALGWAAVNRVTPGGTIDAVIYQPHQFSSVPDKRHPKGCAYWEMTTHPQDFTGPDLGSCKHAGEVAHGILSGEIPDPTDGGVFFFSAPRYSAHNPTAAPGRDFQDMLRSKAISPTVSYPSRAGNMRTYFFKKAPK